jgi:hypothetical protein
LACMCAIPRLCMVIKSALVCLAAVLVLGCSERGILYTSIIEPYSRDFRDTPVGTKSVTTNTHRFKEPVSRLSISGEWDSEIIMRAVRQAGITNLYYIDIKTLSILRGTYRRQTLIVYGD